MIDSAEDLISDSERALTRGITLPHQASNVAMNLFLLTHVHGLGNDARVSDLQKRLVAAVLDEQIDLPSVQLRYAIRLAEAPGRLEYEELHKLLSLADEIYGLRALGFAAEPESVEELERALRARFTAQRRDARMAAEDRVEDWSRGLWWYADLLDSDR
jgi:hypothetical protein